MDADYLFPPVPAIRTLVTLTEDANFSASHLGTIVSLATHSLELVPIIGHGVFHLLGPGHFGGALSGELVTNQSLVVTVKDGVFAIETSGVNAVELVEAEAEAREAADTALQGLVTALQTGKVDISAIVNNLLSTNGAVPLSAAQGKVLSDLIAARVTTTSIVDNLLSTNGGVPLSANQGRLLKALLDGLEANKQNLSGKGIANGYPELDATGKIPMNQIPEALLGAMVFQGVWNATTNTPAIPAAASGNKGHFYLCTVAGTTNISGITDWKVGDWIVSIGTSWAKVDSTDQVSSVAGLQGVISSASLKAALVLGIADLPGLQAALDGLQGEVDERVGAMIDLDEAPVATIESVEIFGTIYPEVRGVLLNAGAGVLGVHHSDTDGRDAFTPDGSFNYGAVYHPLLRFDAGGPQKYKLSRTIGGIGRVWTSNSADSDIRNINSWIWTEGTPGDGIPTFKVNFATTAPGVAGQEYRVEIEGGLFEHYKKMPDNSILVIGTFDALGNQYFSDSSKILRIADDIDDIPDANERVVIGPYPGCTCLGDGLKAVSELPWDGIMAVEVDNEWAVQFLTGGNYIVPSSAFYGAKEIDLVITESLDQDFYLKFGYSSSDARVVRNRKFTLRCSPGITLANPVICNFASGSSSVFGGKHNNAANEPQFQLLDSDAFVVFHYYEGDESPAALSQREVSVTILAEYNLFHPDLV